MKIAYITNSRFPSEKAQSDQVMAMCSSFAKQGNTVKLFAPERTPVVSEDPFAYYHKEKTFEFECVPCVDAIKFAWLGPLGLWIQTFTYARNLRARICDFAPHVVYSREPYIFMFAEKNYKRVWESHLIHKSPWAQRLISKLDGIVTLTAHSKKRLAELGANAGHILVEPDAVDPSLFQNAPTREAARQSLEIPDDSFVFLYTGKFLTMNMSKGVDTAVIATQKLINEGRKVRLIAVGATSQELVQYESFHVPPAIQMRPSIPQSELKRFYRAADCVLMPFPYQEHFAYNMSPLKLFEYLMSGLPIVATDLPSVREILDERTAFFAQPGNVETLAQAMRTIMDSPNDAVERATAARVLGDRYTWDERAARITDWLQTV